MNKDNKEEDENPGVTSINSVIIRLYSKRRNDENDEDREDPDEGNTEVLSHSFRIAKRTTFKELREAALKYWNIKEESHVKKRRKKAKRAAKDAFNLYDDDGEQLTSGSQEEDEGSKRDSEEVGAFFENKNENNQTQDASYGVLYLVTENGSIVNEEEQAAKKDEQDDEADKIQYNETENNFLSKYPGLKLLYTIRKKEDVNNVERMNIRCIDLTVYILMLVFTCILLFMRSSTSDGHYAVTVLRQIFVENFKEQTDLVGVRSFLDDVGLNLLARNVTEDGVTKVQIPQLRGLSIVVEPIRIRQQRTKRNENCIEQTTSNSTSDCYESEYNSDTKNTTTIGDGSEQWHTYQTEKDTKISRTANGDFSDYDGSGYIVDFDPMKTYEDWETLQNSLIDFSVNDPYYSRSTRSLFISFTIFSPSTNLWVACEFLYEFSIIGLVNPAYALIRPFKPNLIETDRESGLLAADIMRLILAIWYILVLLVIKIVQMKSLAKLFSLEILLSITVDLLIVTFSITTFAIIVDMSGKTTQSLISSQSYTDYVDKAYWYHLVFILESFLLLFIILKFLQQNISRSLTIQIMAFANSIKILISYFILLFPILASVAIICMKIWGPFDTNYKTFIHAYISVCFLILGKGDAYLTITIFVAIYTYSYGLTLLSYGYPVFRFNSDDVKWKTSIKNFLRWFLAVLPTKILKRLKLTSNRIEEQDESEENEDESDM